MRLAGYRIHGLNLGSRGEAYTYELAGNGLFLEAENALLRARVLLAPAEVRGLPGLEPFLELRHGPIPAHLLALALNAMSASPDRELYAAIVWDGGSYRLVFPPQEGDAGHVTYEVPPGTVVGIHSHGRLGTFFSATDDRDDQGFLMSVVVGHLDRLMPEVRVRLCIYGYFAPLGLKEVVEGTVPAIERGYDGIPPGEQV